jgi:hypothetical protein
MGAAAHLGLRIMELLRRPRHGASVGQTTDEGLGRAGVPVAHPGCPRLLVGIHVCRSSSWRPWISSGTAVVASVNQSAIEPAALSRSNPAIGRHERGRQAKSTGPEGRDSEARTPLRDLGPPGKSQLRVQMGRSLLCRRPFDVLTRPAGVAASPATELVDPDSLTPRWRIPRIEGHEGQPSKSTQRDPKTPEGGSQ